MDLVIIGNIFGLVGALLMVCLGFTHKRSIILVGQVLQFLIMGVGNLVLGGISGFISNIVGIVRNLFFLKYDMTNGWKLFFVVIQVVISAFFMYRMGFRWIELLPILATVSYTWLLDTKKESHLKMVLSGCQVMWLIYDIAILNYTAAVFDILTLCSNFVGMVNALKEERAISHQ